MKAVALLAVGAVVASTARGESRLALQLPGPATASEVFVARQAPPRMALRLALGDAPAPGEGKASTFDPGTGFLLAGSLVMAAGVVVVFCGISVAVASTPRPPPDPFFAQFNPTEGFITAGLGLAVGALGVVLLFTGLDRRSTAHHHTYAWRMEAGYLPQAHATVVGLGRVW